MMAIICTATFKYSSPSILDCSPLCWLFFKSTGVPQPYLGRKCIRNAFDDRENVGARYGTLFTDRLRNAYLSPISVHTVLKPFQKTVSPSALPHHWLLPSCHVLLCAHCSCHHCLLCNPVYIMIKLMQWSSADDWKKKQRNRWRKNNIHYNRVGASFQEGDNKNTINTTSNKERRMVVTAPHRIAQQQLTKAKLAENLKKRKEGRKEAKCNGDGIPWRFGCRCQLSQNHRRQPTN